MIPSPLLITGPGKSRIQKQKERQKQTDRKRQESKLSFKFPGSYLGLPTIHVPICELPKVKFSYTSRGSVMVRQQLLVEDTRVGRSYSNCLCQWDRSTYCPNSDWTGDCVRYGECSERSQNLCPMPLWRTETVQKSIGDRK